MNIQLSIIIPFFNAQKYLTECLDSIFNNNDNNINFEVICVNDCSQDLSRNIVVEYQQKYDNLILIEHEKNKRAGGARNTGLLNAKGEYVWFVDADDYIDNTKLKKIINIAIDNQLDTIEFNAIHYYRNRQEVHSNRKSTGVMSGIDFIFDKEERYEYKSNSSWVKFFSRNFLIENGLLYDEDVYYEDVLHSFRARIMSERYMFVNDIVYHYRFNPSSMTGNYTATKLIDFYNDHLELINVLIDHKQKIDDLGYDISDIKDYHFKIVKNYKPIMYLAKEERNSFYENFHLVNFHPVNTPVSQFPFPFRFPRLSRYLFDIFLPLLLIVRSVKRYIKSRKTSL